MLIYVRGINIYSFNYKQLRRRIGEDLNNIFITLKLKKTEKDCPVYFNRD